MIVLKSCWYNNTLFFPVSPIGTFSVKVKESTNKHKCNRCGLYLMKSNQTVKYFFFLFKINSQVPLEEVTPLLKCSPVVKPTSVIKYDLNRTLRGLGEGRGESVFVWVLWITSPERGFFLRPRQLVIGYSSP